MLTTRNTPPPEKLLVAGVIKKFLTFYVRKPIIVFTKAYSWAKHEISPQPPIIIKIYCKIIVQLQLGLPINRFPSFFCKNIVFIFPSFMFATCHP